jgi:acetolactate synthase-1/2/3 large subunit
MLFAIGELATAAQEQLPLTAVVIDDGGYGMLRFGHDGEDLGTELTTPDFAAVARGFGIAARTVDGVGEDYATALAEAVASRVPNLLHVRARLFPPRSTSPRWPLRGA